MPKKINNNAAMAAPQLPPSQRVLNKLDYRNDSDEQIGRGLMAAWLQLQAEEHGANLRSIPEAIVARWVEELRTVDVALTSDQAAVEAAIRAAACRDYARAGGIFRGYMLNGAIHLADAPRAAVDRLRQVNNAEKRRIGTESLTKYTPKEKARWIELANTTELQSRSASKAAEHIAELMGYENKAAAVRSIRGEIGRVRRR